MGVRFDKVRQGRKTHVPWSFIIFVLSPWRAPTTGVLLGLQLMALLALLELFSGRPQSILRGEAPVDVGCQYLLGDYRIGIVGVILLAYTTTARFILTRWTHETAALLSGAEFEDAETLAERRRWGFLPGLVGAALCLTFAVDIAERPIEWSGDYWILPHLFNWGWCIPFGWVSGRFFYSVAMNAILISRIARSIDVEDLSNTQPLEQSIRHGSRSAFLSLIFLGLASVHFVDPGVGIVAVLVLVALFVVGVAISTVPVVGASNRLQEVRDARLKNLREELIEEERKMVEGHQAYEPGRIRDIVALERRLEDRRLSIFRVSNLFRLAIYAGVGLLSWLGAAAVSVLVEQLLGV